MTGLTSPPHDENRLSHPRKASFHIKYFHGKSFIIKDLSCFTFRFSFLASLLLVAVIWLSGCGFSRIPNKMSTVKMNMSKEEVAEVLGDSGELKSSKSDPDGKIREIWHYSWCEDLLCETTRFYELRFLDDRLVIIQKK